MVTEMWEMPWWSECQVTTHTLLTGEFNIEISINQTDSGMPQSWDRGREGQWLTYFDAESVITVSLNTRAHLHFHPTLRWCCIHPAEGLIFLIILLQIKDPKWSFDSRAGPWTWTMTNLLVVMLSRPERIHEPLSTHLKVFICDQFMVLVLMGSKLVKL